jgi:hypothetical protein
VELVKLVELEVQPLLLIEVQEAVVEETVVVLELEEEVQVVLEL